MVTKTTRRRELVLLFRRNGREYRVTQPVDGSTAAPYRLQAYPRNTKLR
jgi:hypothetical protein